MRYWIFLLLVSFHINAMSLDQTLRVAIETFDLEGNVCTKGGYKKDLPAMVRVGKVIFEQPVLSGDKDTSCSNCHLDNKALADGLPLAIGVGGSGEGIDRMLSGGAVVPRNAFSLFGRGHENFNTFFWDGKVQKFDGKIFSPIGEGFSLGFDSALSVAAVLPLLARDEFLGVSKPFQTNRHVELVESKYYKDKIPAQNVFIQERLKEVDDPNVVQLRGALEAAELDVEELSLPVVGNALASFIRYKIQDECRSSAWEKYINGNERSLSVDQKKGALIFYGKGRCASCHSGDLLSDMSFHSVGVPQGNQGPHMFGQDLGRALVTLDTSDRYMFRTPPLLSVSKTAPYGHNGVFQSLGEVVKYHISPIFYFRDPKVPESMIFKNGEAISSRSDSLKWLRLTEDELNKLLAFLNTL